MQNNRGKHCLYECLIESVNQETEILLSEFEIFQILGGHEFYYFSHEEANFPNYWVRGNNFNFDLFEESTGIQLLRITEENEQVALKNTLNRLSAKGYQLIICNCYYLTYDEQNYQKNYDNHMVVIHSYLKESDEFLISDGTYNKVLIKREDLILSRKNTTQQKFEYIDLVVNNQIKKEEILERMNRKMLNNAKDFKNKSYKFLDSLQKHFIEVDNCAGIFRKLSWQGMAKSIRSYHGPLYIRRMMGDYFEHKNEVLAEQYQLLAKQWANMANLIMRLSLNKAELHTLEQVYQDIVQKEKDCNEMLLAYVQEEIFN
ncbi:hypothetical protein C1N66_30970 (plasmid) [Bacillus cereus]|uniref:Butirosin biosynthesis protein H N-terminal domain-containing protein n=1 Tax=Bacillus cereus TaxID=1396 RepID=A0AB73USZ2_BACCE|nr:BtrH N-terminal domain-containing protein [Bacillus cereus]HDR3523491.1 hypothetical protein [Bacillus pacificus]QHV07983.1 hypothetical protein C1N82_32830 [Bacillus cereus]QHV47444.1 hypothetical protein C1N66_30970 [Bacillus cereus]HDR3634048.1 hypothetical protein [Bacillus pacificus]HDR7652984.1 hypothetical protein [Bacillus pacificus]